MTDQEKPMSEFNKEDISTDHPDIKYIRRYNKQIYANNLENLDERGKV